VNDAAAKLGLMCGQALSNARAMAPDLIVERADPTGDHKAFIKLCTWHMRYSPFVTPYGTNDILINITGAVHLFGGEERLLDEARSKLTSFGVKAFGAIASSAGAAWACAHAYEQTVIPVGEEESALAGLPVSALRLDETTVENLKSLGLKTIAQLSNMPRAPLAARFGRRLSERLDQAFDRMPEVLTPLQPAPDYSATRKLAEPISTEQNVLACLDILAKELHDLLLKDGKGARRFELALYRVDNEVTRIRVGTSAPAREMKHVARLFKNRLEDSRDDLDAGFGFEVIRLSARDCQTIGTVQADALSAVDMNDSTAALIDRLSNRLGSCDVVRIISIDTHIPERAVFYTPALSDVKNASGAPPNAERPLRLLPKPEAVAVMAEVPDGPPIRFQWRRISYRVLKASGPERIEDEWWREETQPVRDYFRIETMEGWRFWIFRAGFYSSENKAPQWFLHGFFP